MEGVGMTSELALALRGKNVLVTGHTGFKGSWLTIWLERLGARVTGYSMAPPTTPSNFEVSRVRELLASHHEGDIRDGERLRKAVAASDPAVIFHLAAQPLVRESYDHPRETLEVNVIGTASLLDAVTARGKPCAVVIVTSDKCYENREHIWGYRETDHLGGHDPYSASKGAAEIVVSAYRRSFFPLDRVAEHGVRLASVRAGNVIGGGDWAQGRLVPDIVRSIASGRAAPLRNPDAVRPWQHVLDPLGGYLLLASRMLSQSDPALCDAWNFGPIPGDDVPVARLAEWVIKAWGSGSIGDARRPDQPHEARSLRLSIDKAVAYLGWRPRWGVREAVERTVAWYARHARTGESMLETCVEQIADWERQPEQP
jgi:CDP-glucose 4,6-dehydratase